VSHKTRAVAQIAPPPGTRTAMSDLRTRIAAVVHKYSVPIPMAELVADAVIREVGLSMKPQEIVEDWHGKCRTYD